VWAVTSTPRDSPVPRVRRAVQGFPPEEPVEGLHYRFYAEEMRLRQLQVAGANTDRILPVFHGGVDLSALSFDMLSRHRNAVELLDEITKVQAKVNV